MNRHPLHVAPSCQSTPQEDQSGEGQISDLCSIHELPNAEDSAALDRTTPYGPRADRAIYHWAIAARPSRDLQTPAASHFPRNGTGLAVFHWTPAGKAMTRSKFSRQRLSRVCR